MIFRQLFDSGSSTYTYLLGCEATRQAILVDPVLEMMERDLAELISRKLRLACTVETHVHADHVTAAWQLRERTGCRVAYPAMEQVACADLQLATDRPLMAGSVLLLPLPTPGHSAGHHCYLLEHPVPMVFTGDTLLIDGCGRTDLDGGDAETLFRSVHDRLFALPEETLVYPGHDYNQRRVSTIAQERARNQRLNAEVSAGQFVQIMAELDLPPPAKMNTALPANRGCGRCPRPAAHARG